MLYFFPGLIGVLFLTFILFFCLRKFQSLLSPSVALVAMFWIGMFVFALYSVNWEIVISLKTIFVILVGLCSFIFGELFSRKIKFSTRLRFLSTSEIFIGSGKELKIKTFPFLFFLFISTITLYSYFQYTYRLSVAAGNTFGYERMLNFAYYAKYNLTGMPNEPTYVTIGLVFSSVFAVYSLYVFINNRFVSKSKVIQTVYLLPVVIYIFQASLAGGRTQFLRLAIKGIVIYLVVANMYGKHKFESINFKQIGQIVLIMLMFLMVYKIYGDLRGSLSSGLDNIIVYPGTPIAALNEYLKSPTMSSTFGEETLITVKHILNKLGFNFKVASVSLPQVTWNNGSTNIYTAFRRYIADYTLVGMIIIMFFMGVFYGALYKRIKMKKTISSVILYGFLLYPVTECLFEERFFIGVLSAGTVYFLITIWLMKGIVAEKA